MRINDFKAILKVAVCLGGVLFSGAVAAYGQQQINLTAAPATVTLPDGSQVPMWGYSCGTVVPGSSATCAKLNTGAGTGWSPVVITIPTTAAGGLRVNLTNNLSFTAGAGKNGVPTSLVIVGQLGGGLGVLAQRTTTPSPDHSNAQAATTWPIANSGPSGTPPLQGPRVQSFATEVLPGAMKPLTWSGLRPGTYLFESGTHPSIQGPMGLYGILVVTTAPSAGVVGLAYPGVTYNADVPLLFSEIDPVQNNAVTTAVGTVGFTETAVWSGQPNQCGNPASANYHTCYPPAVNYIPLYYMINGVAFNKTNSPASLFPISRAVTPGTGLVLVRLVNAGLRMHVPSIIGSLTGTPAVAGMSLIAEDGNVLPGVGRVQNEVFMAAGKTYDVMVNAPATSAPPATALPIYDRELSLSGNAVVRDAGMLAYVGINGSAIPNAPALTPAQANPDAYTVVPGETLTVSDPSKGVIANDINVYGVKVATAPTKGVLTLFANGTFTYVPNAGWTAPDSFFYQANGTGPTAKVTLTLAPVEATGGIVVNPITYNSTVATSLAIKTPGPLAVDKDLAGYPLTVNVASVSPAGGLTVVMAANGGFNASVPGPGTYTFQYKAQNSQGTLSAAATVTINFPTPVSPITVTVKDPSTGGVLTDYRWVIEEDRTFFVNPTKTVNTGPTGPIVPTYGVNFHTSSTAFVAQGCTGPLSCESGQSVLGVPAVCDVGNGVCRTTATQQTAVDPSKVSLDPAKRYYISVLPGDAANPFNGAGPGHTMGGAPIPIDPTTLTRLVTSITVLVEPTPLPPGKLSVIVFEDDFPLNGEQDAGGGVDILSPNEPGLGGFNLEIFDAMGGSGDFTGQMTYDMFNMPLSNSLAGTIDPVTGLDACPISTQATGNTAQAGITGQIVTCPKYESDGATLSPLAGQALIANLMPGRFSVVATPGADRIARGEEWLQTNTLDGQKAHDAFIRIGEPSYFQEFGPAGYHVSIGFANPKIINNRLAAVCSGADLGPLGPCNNSVTGKVTGLHLSRTPDERLYSTGTRDTFGWTQCYVSLGDPDGEDFAFTKCDIDGNFTLTGLPAGDWRVTLFDQWNDQIVDGLSVPLTLGGGTLTNMKDVPVTQWQANLYTRTFIDDNKNGVYDKGEAGIPLIPTTIRYRDGSLSNNLTTDFNGVANFNETFPLFNWYVVEADTTRYKTTGIHTVYDTGGPVDGSASCGVPGYPPCGTSTIGKNLANTLELVSLPTSPTNLRVPGAVYCKGADCAGKSIQSGAGSSDPPSNCTTSSGITTCSTTLSTGRIDTPWTPAEGWQGFTGQNNFIEFGKAPFAPGENGGIRGHVIYASTRPFDDPILLVQTQWEPLVPHVTINLYQEGTAPDGTQSLTLVDTTQTSSWDDWSQGFRSDSVPNMNCPGQSTGDLFYFTLYNQVNWLNPGTALPYNSQFKCYDGMHNWNQLQPAPYDGMYSFPSVTSTSTTTGKPLTTNCAVCKTNPDASDTLRFGTPMLPAGKYVVEVVVPPGFELVKEEDKNILIGDSFIAPVTQEFATMASIFIIPDQAAIGSAYNANNPNNPTTNLGTGPHTDTVPGFPFEPVWACVGQARVVPDFISLFPQSKEVSPFAGATRNLCDRKEVVLTDQMAATAKFYIYTSTHIAAKFTGVITDDFTSEFDPFSPQFGEKFSPPNLPVSVRDWAGNEISRVYADQWGLYNGLNYSTWEVNPPNPTGYSPTMMVMCMNDPGSGPTPDPLYQSGYSQFCYELPFMPGQTDYLDTPVVPTAGFSEGYNHPDCEYPDTTPAVSTVTGDVAGPWVLAAGHTLTINSLPDQQVNNYAYSGPSATAPPFNQKKITRHYGFGATQGVGGVTIGGVKATVTSWSGTQIQVTVPPNVPLCAIQQQALYGGPNGGSVPAERCGELIITADNGRQSVDAVTVTIGGKTPIPMAAGATIQSAIDAAQPGDLIIVPPGVYTEFVLMWKPVRLQGVGAASSIINANTQPAGRLDPWRRQVDCLFGIAINGRPISPTNPYDPPSDKGNNGGPWICPAAQQFSVDRLPLEAVVGWDATLNGNLAEQLQEPTLMGAYEGAGITVLGKGVKFPTGSNPFGSDTFPPGTVLLTAADCTSGPSGANPYPSNFLCNPSRIDGLSVTDSSQGGGGVFVHAYGHYLEIANNRIHSNTGTLSGGINVGQGEFAPANIVGGTAYDPPSCYTGQTYTGLELPYCFDLNVNVHHNSVTLNSSIGDELFSATPAGAGGVSFCTGADYYKFNYNWVCGNLSAGDGGGFAHLGMNWNGDIEHNAILFNQSTNPTIPTNGGGMIIQGTPDTDPVCGTQPDQDCPPGMSDGTGPGLVINANLIQGNMAESGAGGGLRFQGVNGTDISTFPSRPDRWYSVAVINNVIVDNVAGWDGGGVSFQDALAVNFVNNTVVSNDSTATAGVLTTTLGAPLASGPPPPGTTGPTGSTSLPQPGGLAVSGNSPVLALSLTGLTITCPPGHYAPGTPQTGKVGSASAPTCTLVSYPELYNDLLWQNRSFFVGVGSLSNQYQQNIITMYPTLSQPRTDSISNNGGGTIITGGTGACAPGASYWDLGVRGDTGPRNHSSKFTLAPTYSVITDITGYTGLNNLASNPTVVAQYCNGARIPPECTAADGCFGAAGYDVPPGISDATVPNPIFSLLPSATVDEGNNWINVTFGPLSQAHPVTGLVLGNYALATGSPAIDYIPTSSVAGQAAPPTDFFGNPRPDADSRIDVGAIEHNTALPVTLTVTPTSLAFGTVTHGTTSAPLTLTLRNTGTATASSIALAFTPAVFTRSTTSPGTCGLDLAGGASCTINVVFTPAAVTSYRGTVTISALSGTNPVTVINSPVALTGTGN